MYQAVNSYENFRALADTAGVGYEGIFIQGRYLNSGLPLIGQS